MDYNHKTMFEGVKNAWCDGGGCHWCGRATITSMKGHDGFCPVPAMFALEKEKNVLRRLLRAEGHSDTGLDVFVESYLSPLEALREIGKIPGMQDALQEMEESNGR